MQPIPRRALWGMMTALAAMTALSQFHRSALAVIAPEVARALEASPARIGAAHGAFFLALLVAQVPVGIALDRIGPRRTVAALTVLAAIGAALQGLAPDATAFIAARFLLGLGCAASFMASVVLCARWFGGAALTTALSRVFALSQLGNLLAAAPMAAAATALGWRGALAASALLTALAGIGWWAAVQDDPPGRAPPARPKESIGQALRGQWEVWRTPGLLPILSLHAVGYAAAATVLGIWAAPYLADVHGLSPAARGAVITAMVLAFPAGQLLIGPMERRLNTRKWLAVGFALATALILAGLALLGAASLAATVALLMALGLCGAFPVVVVAHGRSLFADHQVGRGATTVNLAQVLGSAALPALCGAIVGLYPADAAGARPETAYAAAFWALAAAVVLGTAGYLASKDAPPRR
jgi:predicted MFS family arabinose efflux permease